MNKRILRHGKLLRLHRKNYRQLEHRLIRLITWAGLLLLMTVPAFAAYTTPPEVSSATMAATPKSSPAPTEPNVQANTVSQPVDKPTPEITIEIKDAEYTPPAPKPEITINPVGSAIGGSGFQFGYCTWYVASRRPVTWSGNAGSWYSQAQAAGYKVGQTPSVGAIMVSYEGSSAGHVAYVESVHPDGSFTVSEMNYNGNWGRVTSRTIRPGQVYIIGFIY